jgi:hypothetical protein
VKFLFRTAADFFVVSVSRGYAASPDASYDLFRISYPTSAALVT